MSIIQDARDKIDQYFEQKPATEYYDEMDAVYEIVFSWSDDQLMQAVHEEDLWQVFLNERLDTPVDDTVRELLLSVLSAEILR